MDTTTVILFFCIFVIVFSIVTSIGHFNNKKKNKYIKFEDVLTRLDINVDDFYGLKIHSDHDTQHHFGSSVDVNKSGDIFIISSRRENSELKNDIGVSRIYKYENHLITQLGQDIVGENEFDESGVVSINDIGDIVAIGAPDNDNNNNNSAGHVRVYKYSQTQKKWNKIGGDIDGSSGSQFGQCLSLNGDGTRIAIGYLGFWQRKIDVYEYQQIGNIWNQIGTIDTSGLTTLINNKFDIKISKSGDRIVSSNCTAQSKIEIFEKQGHQWVDIGVVSSTDDFFGYSFSMDDEANILVIGSPQADGTNVGKVYIYKYVFDGTNYSYSLQNEIPGSTSFTFFGQSVSLGKDGVNFVVTDSSNIYLYELNSMLVSWNIKQIISHHENIHSLDHECTIQSNTIVYSNKRHDNTNGIVVIYKKIKDIFSEFQ